MSKLFAWLTVLSALTALWISAVYGPYDPTFKRQFIYPAPFVAAMLFALVSLVTILVRVSRLITRIDASEELQKDIKEAKEELQKLGIVGKTD
ncbi:hypothetical protein ACHWQZ_G004546 [Mnemiopsis leidyi]